MSEHQKDYEYFVDARAYRSESSTMTGAQIKASAMVTANYQLFLEEEGDHPDKAISDAEVVELRGRIKHFFAIPPATFGKQ
ncbi:MAG TPA: multiubiquitin domain-containing protein [Rhizomicrobium sp.]|jgi:hypothetical protein